MTTSKDSGPLDPVGSIEAIEWPATAWKAEFLRQATPETMEGALAYAGARLAGLDGLTCGLAPEDLVHDAVLATRGGVIRWRPDRVSLCAHLCDRVSQALRRMRREAQRAVQLDHLDDSHEEGQAIEQRLLSYSTDFAGALDLRNAARAIEAALWRLSANDQPALAFMNAIANGADDDNDIAAMAGLSLAAVVAARRRLRRRSQTLPSVLRADARSLMS